MDATIFIPRQFHAGLKALGKCDWFKIVERGKRPDGHGYVQSMVDVGEINRAMQHLSHSDRKPALMLLGQLLKNGSSWSAVLLTKLLASGPKVFQVSEEQADAMANVAVDIMISDYQQPFPVVVVEMPPQFVRTHKAPRYVAVYHDAVQNLIFTLCDNVVHSRNGVVHSTTITDDTSTIEHGISTVGTDQRPELGDDDFVGYRLAERVAINCCLLLTQYRMRLEPLRPHLKKLERVAMLGKNKAERERAQRQMTAEFNVIRFDQQVRFHDEEQHHDHRSEHHPGWHVKPHWRKGHWRRQVCGTGRTDRKLIFIRPMLVRRDRFVGDVADTSAVYVVA